MNLRGYDWMYAQPHEDAIMEVNKRAEKPPASGRGIIANTFVCGKLVARMLPTPNGSILVSLDKQAMVYFD
jgi:hypothetical protein